MTNAVLGRFQLLRLVATGGMGEVFLAVERGVETPAPVVIKRILRHLQRDLTWTDLFMAEAKVATRCLHPNVARVYGLERVDDELFLVQEYVHGVTLRRFSEAARQLEGGVPGPVAVTLAIALLGALEAVHSMHDEQGRPLRVVHGDVSPDNVLVSFKGQLKLVDFGLARPAGATQRLGTAGHVAPEVLARGPVDFRADLFAVGVTLRELLGGQPIDTELEAALAQATAKVPEARFASAAEFAAALTRWARRQPAPDLASRLIQYFGRDQVESQPSLVAADALEVEGTTSVMPAAKPTAPKVTPKLPSQRWLVVSLVLVLVALVASLGWWASALRSTPHQAGSVQVDADVKPAPKAVDDGEAPKVLSGQQQGSGRVVFRLPRGTEVTLDGRRVGVAPLAPMELEPGPHEVVLRSKRFRRPKRLSLQVQQGADVVVRWRH